MERRSVANRAEDEDRRRADKGKGKKAFTGRPDGRRCFNCQRFGHISRDCKFKNEGKTKKRRREDSDSSDDENESATQKNLKRAAKVMARGAKYYDAAMMAATFLKNAEKGEK